MNPLDWVTLGAIVLIVAVISFGFRVAKRHERERRMAEDAAIAKCVADWEREIAATRRHETQ